MSSLRGRLLAFLLGLAAVAVAALGFVSYRAVLAETDQILDYQLQQMALSLRDQGAVPEDQRAVLEDPRLDYVIQVWTVDGTVTYSSHPMRWLPRRTVLGFDNVDVDGQPWRVYSTTARDRIVRVAQPLAVRKQLAAAAARRTVAPVVVAAPLVALAVWWLVGLSLAPLRGLVAAVRARDSESLAPLAANGLPSEITPLVDALNALLARLNDAFRTQRSFVADAAHELRSPLTALKLQVDLVRRAPDEASRTAALWELTAGMDRLQRLVDQLLTLARAEPGGAEAAFAQVDLAEAAREAAADTVPLAASSGADLALEAPAAVTVRGDRAALRILARNLVDNAVRYAGSGGHVRVDVREEAGQALLRVDDSGPGIPDAERARVFDRFYRRDTGDAGGSGLGLAIVHAIAERHHAEVVLGDSPLGGLRVEVRFAAGDASALTRT